MITGRGFPRKIWRHATATTAPFLTAVAIIRENAVLSKSLVFSISMILPQYCQFAGFLNFYRRIKRVENFNSGDVDTVGNSFAVFVAQIPGNVIEIT